MEYTEKRCSKCESQKAIELFSKFSKSKDGYKAWCKTCSTEYMRQYREANPTYRQKEREYYYKRNEDPAAILANLTKAVEKCKIRNIPIPSFSEIHIEDSTI